MGVVERALGMRRSGGGRSGIDDERAMAVRGLEDLLGDAVVRSEAGRMLFRGDGAVLASAPPSAVVLPGNERELVEAVRYCHAHGLEMVPRGGATSIRGGAIGAEGSVVISTTRLNRIIDVDRRDRLLRAEAGVTLTMLGRAVREAGLRLAVLPRGRTPATLGGAIAKNSLGAGWPAAGAMAGIIEALRLVAANGEVVEIECKAQACGGYDLAGVIAGSEGAFGIISEATVRLMPKSPAARLIVARFDDEAAALAAAEAVLQHNLPTGAVAVVGGEVWGGQSAGLSGLSTAAGETFVLVEVEGFDQEVARGAEAVAALLGERAPGAIEEAADDSVRADVWALQETAPARLSRGRTTAVSDIVVPLGRVGEALGEMRGIAERHALSLVTIVQLAYGGVQSIFVAPDNLDDNAGRVLAALDDAVAVAGDLGGLATGPYGAGVLKAVAAGTGGLDQSAFAMQHLVKAVFDGKGVMNPGKVLVAADV